MKKILTTQKVTAATLLLGCLSGVSPMHINGRNPAFITAANPKDQTEVVVKAGNQKGEILIQLNGDSKKIFYSIVADISGRIVAKRIIYPARQWRISGLAGGLYRYSIYSNRRLVCSGEIKTI